MRYLAYALVVALLAALPLPSAASARLVIKPAGTCEAPPTVEEMLFMADRPTRERLEFCVPEIGTLKSGTLDSVSWYRGSWKNPAHVADFHGCMSIPEDGLYKFAVNIRKSDPVYMWVDGELAVIFSNLGGGHDESVWFVGGGLKLKRGDVRIRVITLCRDTIRLRLGWIPPGGELPVEIPSDVWKDYEESAFVEVPYSFRGMKGAFRNRLATDGTIKTKYHDGEKPLVEYRLDAMLSGMRTIAFEGDLLHPTLEIRSNAPSNIVLRAVARVKRTGGEVRLVESALDFKGEWTHLILPECTAGDLENISWSVEHIGVCVVSGRTSVMRQPFSSPPDDLRGEMLTLGGADLILTPRQTGRRSVKVPRLRSGRVFVLDGFISASGHAAGSSESAGRLFDHLFVETFAPPGFRRQRLVGLQTPGEPPRGCVRLDSFTRLDELRKDDTVIVAPGIGGYYEGESLEDFSRRLSAMAGLLCETLECAVILVTPPPDLFAPGKSRDMREYAAAIHRIADVNGATVADLYTHSMTRKLAAGNPDSGTLSEAGVRALIEIMLSLDK